MFRFHHSLRAACLFVLIATMPVQSSEADADVALMSVHHLARILDANVTVIDVRRDDEWRATGVIEGSQLITAYDANGRLNPDFIAQVARIADPEETIALVCRSGRRSALAARLLSEHGGFTSVSSVDGGIKAWVQSRKPVSPCLSC